jgi:hypothetical protein
MDQIKKYTPILLIVLFAVIVTGLAIFVQGSQEKLSGSDSWRIPYWLTPLAYLALALLFKGGPDNMNKPIFTLIAFFTYALAGVALFFPLPPQVQWHYIIGVVTIAYIFFG